MIINPREADRCLKAEVLIVGSGAGGSTTAFELAKAGYNVVVLEEGARQVSTYGAEPTQSMQNLYRNQGMTPIMGSVPLGFVEGRCLGGSTEINSGFWHRLPPEFALRWSAQYNLDDAGVEELKPHYEWAEDLLRVGYHPTGLPASSAVLRDGAEAMGWSAKEVPRAASGCANTNTCASGCEKGAKQGMTRSLIPMAEYAGAKFITNTKVRLLLKQKKRITGVLAEVSTNDGTELVRVEADHVFVCAGPTQTPVLLRRSGVLLHVGDTFQVHPMLKVSAQFEQEINAQESVLPLLQVKEFFPDISLGGSYFTPGHLAMVLSENWPSSHATMRNYRNMATYYVSVRGTGKGSVRPSLFFDEDAILKYEISDVDIRNLSQGFARLCSLLLAAGAKKVFPSVQGLSCIDSEIDAVRWLDQPLPRAALSLTTVHAFSTCPIGERKDRCAANSYGKIFGLENLYINDASMLPSSPGINPQGTVMALAHRNALNFVAMN